MARDYLSNLHAPRALQERVAHLVRNHMFSYQSNWSDAAVRRFIRKVGPGSIDDLLALRAADNEGSGLSAEAGLLPELERRVRDELAAHASWGGTSWPSTATTSGRSWASGPVDARPDPGRAHGASDRRAALNDRAILLELARALADNQAGGESGRSLVGSYERGALMFEVLLQADRALASGALDQAERSYWQLIELDPTNAIAVAGLARSPWSAATIAWPGLSPTALS